MHCISDSEDEIRQVAGVTNSDLIVLVRETTDECVRALSPSLSSPRDRPLLGVMW